MKKSYRAILLAGLGLSAVSAAQAQEMYLGFTDTGSSATAQNDLVLDLGSYANFTTNASLNGTINASLISAGFGSVDANYLNDVSVGAVAGASTPTKFVVQTVGFVSPLSAPGVGSAASLMTAFSTGEYPAGGNATVPQTQTWSYNVAVDPNTIGSNPSGSVAGDTGNMMAYLNNGTVSEQLWSAVVGGTLRNPTVTETLLGTLKVDLTHDQWTFTGVNLTPPAAGFSGTPTSGGAPLKVTFTDASTGNITNWLWSFGDGHSVTNTSNASVTNLYASAGTYTVSLKVTGPTGNNTLSKTGYIVVSSAAPPTFTSVNFSGGNLVISGTNGTASTQYRVLMSTNLSAGSWVPVFTNQFLSNGSFSYTNSSATNGAGYFRLISP